MPGNRATGKFFGGLGLRGWGISALVAAMGWLILLESPQVLAEAPSAEVNGFVDEMVKSHRFDQTWLTALMSEAAYRQSIIDAITRPAEAKPWHEYRPIFLTSSRIEGGVEFWNKHAELLDRAEQKFGVPAQIIVAIIGVESRYGRHTGKYRVIDSLSTLAFHYPKRSKFFRAELEQFLLLSRDEKVDPRQALGSYAGAMGQPQFIASSYRRYAVDFDGDGKRDLWTNEADIIGSVGNYLATHKWQRGEAIASPASVSGEDFRRLIDSGLKPKRTVSELRNGGVELEHDLGTEMTAALLELEGKGGPEYWVTLDNFYVITRYNHSALYAMAVFQLGEEIRAQRGKVAAAS